MILLYALRLGLAGLLAILLVALAALGEIRTVPVLAIAAALVVLVALGRPRRVHADGSPFPQSDRRLIGAIEQARITLFAQDRDLVYRWIVNPRALDGTAALGRSDEEILHGPSRDEIIALKRQVIADGEPASAEIMLRIDGKETWFRLHASPEFAGRDLIGIAGSAIDITDEKAAQIALEQLTIEQEATVQRFELALSDAGFSVCTQDRNLRYLWASANPFEGVLADGNGTEIVGRTDRELLPSAAAAELEAMKLAVLSDGEARHIELRAEGPSDERWWDIRAQPLRDRHRQAIGVISALRDITHRKLRETHVQLLMRELAHRSKNTLAVIEAMARQTLIRASSLEAFGDQFSARLHSLAGSHDLLVQQNWSGARLTDVIRSQLGHHLADDGQIDVEGPELFLSPEAAQYIGLALHELSTNAAKHGALSVPGGQVIVRWGERTDAGADDRLWLHWTEQGGPAVVAPTRRGFGAHVTERIVARALNGKVKLDYAPAGVIWQLDIPAAAHRVPKPA